jgi:hypothetical protein
MNTPQDHETKAREIVEQLKAGDPDLRLFEIIIPGREEEVFLARKAPWIEYKGLIGAIKDEAAANEALVEKFLVHPKPDHQVILTEWDPGLIVTLAQQIQVGLGFAKGASIKNW